MRIIATVVLMGNEVIQTYGFNEIKKIGKPICVLKHLDSWGVDEIVLCQADGSHQDLLYNLNSAVSMLSTPLTVSGGIINIHQCNELMRNGADRLCFNSALFQKDSLLSEVASRYGGQSITLKFDINPLLNRLRNGLNFYEFSTWLQDNTSFLLKHDITDIFFYDTCADGLRCLPDFGLLANLDLSRFSVVLGGGMSFKTAVSVYSLNKNRFKDLSLSFSNLFYQRECAFVSVVDQLAQAGVGFNHRLLIK